MKRASSIKNYVIAAAALLCIFSAPAPPPVAAQPADNILPTPQLEGTLDDTPQTVTLCSPLRIQYLVRSTGTVTVSSAILAINIKAADTGASVFARQVPFTLDAGSIMIENVSFPPGAYSILLKASAINQQSWNSGEVKLAERALTIPAPVMVKKSSAAVPRVLFWLSRAGTAMQQAFAEKIVKQALDVDSIYSVIVDTAEEFTNQALTGDFNTTVLYEPAELLDQYDWLMARIARGHGLVIIGSDNRARMIAENFGFKYGESLTTTGAMLQLTDDSGLGLTGTVPVSGRILPPKKINAKTAALIAGDKRPAMLIDDTGNGRVIVMPFSLTRSALDAGTTSLYSLLLRAVVQSAALENDEQTSVSSIELLVSAPSGTVRARVVETLPLGTRVIWTNGGGMVKDNAIIYDLIADKEPQRFLYLCQPLAGNKTSSFTEAFFECNEKLVSQGAVE